MKTRSQGWMFVAFMLWFLCFGTVPAAAGVIYVDVAAAGANSGLSWADAFVHLQDALAAAGPGDDIWVAAGTYTPDQGVAVTLGDRSATFLLESGVALYGGFPAGGGDWGSRNITANVTTLSGDLTANDGANFANNSENSYHVITGSGVDATAVLDGFTVTAGYGNGTTPNDRGAGMYSSNGQAIIRDCTFNANKATFGGGMTCEASSTMQLMRVTFSSNRSGDYAAGGGMRIYQSNPTLTECVFSGNWASSGAGLHAASYNGLMLRCSFLNNNVENNGAGLYLYGAQAMKSLPNMVGCIFSGNTAQSSGGGIYCSFYTYPYLANCLFINNKAYTAGGGMFSSEGGPKLTNCVFSGNKTGTSYYATGGGLANDYRSTAELRNCTFSGNSSVSSGGLYVYYSTVTLSNNVFWGNTATQGAQMESLYLGVLGVSDSDVQGGQAGVYVSEGTLNWYTGNIDADPLFVDADGADNVAGTADDNLRLASSSPAVDAGSNHVMMADTADLDADGNTAEAIPYDYDFMNRFVDDPIADTGMGTPPIVDMGAFERSGTAAVCGDAEHQSPVGDLSQDCRVNTTDLVLLAGYWLGDACAEPAWCGGADLDHLGGVNLNDFTLFASYWLVCTAPDCD